MTISPSPTRTVLGKASLWTGIAGAVLSLVLGIALLRSANGQERPGFERFGEWPYALGGALVVILGSVAFGCGLAAKRTAAGKEGLTLSFFAFAHLAFLSTAGAALVMLMIVLYRRLLEEKPDLKPAGNDDEAV
jgi:hypothetical protein